MKQSYTVPVRLSEDLLRKLIYISEAEGRNPQSQFTLMLRNNIQYFERTKGKFNQSKLNAIDISEYTKDEELYEILTDTVKALLTKQDELGRFSTYAVDKEFNGWDMWSRKYVLLGFQYFLDICRDEKLYAEILTDLEARAKDSTEDSDEV